MKQRNMICHTVMLWDMVLCNNVWFKVSLFPPCNMICEFGIFTDCAVVGYKQFFFLVSMSMVIEEKTLSWGIAVFSLERCQPY